MRPVVLAVHGFASSAYANWIATGWVRELNRAGYRVLALDQRGHGRSGKPHDPGAYSMALLVEDVQTVLDTYLVDEAVYVGYSLGARVGWHAAVEGTSAITRAVLGGIPDGDPLTRFRVDEAKASSRPASPLTDRLTQRLPHDGGGDPGQRPGGARRARRRACAEASSRTRRTRRSSRCCSRQAARIRSSRVGAPRRGRAARASSS